MMKTAILKFINRFTRKPSGVELASDVIADYTASRGKLDNTYICHAPFSNMYFNVHGDCAPCWLTFIDPDSYKEKSIREISFAVKIRYPTKAFVELRSNTQVQCMFEKFTSR